MSSTHRANGDAVAPRRFVPHHHAVWRPEVIEDIQLKAELGRYRYRGTRRRRGPCRTSTT